MNNDLYKTANNKPHLSMRPTVAIVPAQGPSSTDRENIQPPMCPVRPRFRIVSRRHYHRPRHHNPGTTYRTDPRLHRHPDRRINLLSSKVVVPPNYQIPESQPSTSRKVEGRPCYRRPKLGDIEAQWRQPKLLNLSPVPSAWKKERALVPPPTIDYRYGFDVYPGEAYQPVVWFEDKNASWPPTKLDIDNTERPRVYDALGKDPRSQDLRVLLDKLHVRDLREKLNLNRAGSCSTPASTPEEAVARLHGEIPYTSTEQSAQSNQAPRPPATTQEVSPTWPGPPRRRRRCRLIIIEKPR